MDIVNNWGTKDIFVSSDLSGKSKPSTIVRRSNIQVNSIIKVPSNAKTKSINKPLPALNSGRIPVNTPVSSRPTSKIYNTPRSNVKMNMVRRDSFIQSSSNDSLDMFQNDIIDVSNKERNSRDVYELKHHYNPIVNTDGSEYKLTKQAVDDLNRENIACSNCKNCYHCKNCFNCTDCVNCYNCADCTGCESCKNCIGLKNKKSVQDRYVGNSNVNTLRDYV